MHRTNRWCAPSRHTMVPIHHDVRDGSISTPCRRLPFASPVWYSTCSITHPISSTSNSTLTRTTRIRSDTSAPNLGAPSGACPSWSPGSFFSTCTSRFLSSADAPHTPDARAITAITTFVLLADYPRSPDPTIPRSPQITLWATFLGVTSGLFAAIQYAPQLIRTYQLKLVGALSIPMMVIQTPGGIVMSVSIAMRPGTDWTSASCSR